MFDNVATVMFVSAILGAGHITLLRFSFMKERFRHPPEIANRITCSTVQVVVISMSTYNLIDAYKNDTKDLISPNTIAAANGLAAMFLYDTVFMLSSPRGRRQHLMFAHHVLAVILLYMSYSPGIGSNQMNNFVLLTLETASPLINAMKISDELAPGALVTHHIHMWTQVMYFLTRIVMLPMWMVDFYTMKYSGSVSHVLTLFALLCLWGQSIKWFVMLLKPKRV